MKQKTLLISFMFLALLLSTSIALASEVTGNLSSSGNNSGSQGTTTETTTNTGAQSPSGGGGGTPDDGTLAGSVGSTSSNSPESGGGGNNNDGAVLGASTANTTAPAKTSPNTLSPDKVAPKTATAFGAFSEFTAANWFWIIVLSLILLAVIAYIYNDDKKQPQSTMLNQIN